MKFKLLKPLFFILMMFCGCKYHSSNKMECFSEEQKRLKGASEYRDVLGSASSVISTLKNRNGKVLFDNGCVNVCSKLDSVVFFNEKKDKCLLLLLQKSISGLENDQIRIIQGTLEQNRWTFSYDRMPDVPEVTFSVAKHEKKTSNINDPFKVLSDKGIEFVLNAGTTFDDNCKIDVAYWFAD